MALYGKRTEQQSRVYAAQQALAPSVVFGGAEDAQSYADAMTASWWWGERYPGVHRIEVYAAQGNSTTSHAGFSEGSCCGLVTLSREGMNNRTLAHETAHVISVAVDRYAGHGPKFVRRYLELVSLLMGSEAYLTLWTAFVDAGVDIG